MNEDVQYALSRAQDLAEKRAKNGETPRGPGYFLTQGGYDLSSSPPPSRKELTRREITEQAKERSRRLRNVMPVYDLPFSSPPAWDSLFGPRGLAALRIMLVHIETILRVILRIGIWFFTTIIKFVQLFTTMTVIYLFIAVIVLYMVQIFWPLALSLLLNVVLPLTNVAIEVANFIIELLIMVMRMLFEMWNMVLPFIFMVITVVLDIFVTILKDIFDILGGDAFQGLVQGLMEVLFFLVDIAVQVLIVLIQIGIPILQAFAGVVSLLIEAILSVVEILLPIVVWLVGLLFEILEPILFAVKALVSVFSWALVSKSFASRKLLSLGLSAMLLNGTTDIEGMTKNEANEDVKDPLALHAAYLVDIYEQWEKMVIERKLANGNLTDVNEDSCRTSSCNHLFEKDKSLYENVMQAGGPELFSEKTVSTPTPIVTREEYETARKLLSERDDRHKVFEKASSSYTGSTDRTTQVISRSLHQGVHNMVKQGANIDLMHSSLSKINEFRRQPRHHYSLESILARARRKDPSLYASYVKGPAHVSYSNEPQHPHVMQVTFHKELKEYRQKHGLSDSIQYAHGRKLMDLEKTYQWDGSKRLHARKHSQMELEFAKKIAQQGKKYEDYHVQRLKVIHTVHNSWRGAMLKHAQTTLSFENISHHWNAILKGYGYKSMMEVYNDFIEKHGTVGEFLSGLRAYSEDSRLMKFLEKQDERKNSHPFMHEWKRLEGYRANSRTAGRKLLEDNRDQQLGEPGASPSEERLNPIELISKTNCFSSPRNPLCMPKIPQGLVLVIPKIKIPTDIEEDEQCPPWQNTNCLFCLTRLHNFWQSFRYILSALPPINFFFTFFTAVVPWMSWAVNWIFVVPKGETTSLFMFLCFVKHWYDIVITFLVFWLLYEIIYPLGVAVVEPIINAWRRDREIARGFNEAMNDTSTESARINRLFYQLNRSSRYAWNTGKNWFPYYLRGGANSYVWYGGQGPPYYANPPPGIGSRIGRTMVRLVHGDDTHQETAHKVLHQLRNVDLHPADCAAFLNTVFAEVADRYQVHDMIKEEDTDKLSSMMTALKHTHSLMGYEDEEEEDEAGVADEDSVGVTLSKNIASDINMEI